MADVFGLPRGAYLTRLAPATARESYRRGAEGQKGRRVMPTTKAAYWQEMKEKAAENISDVSEWIRPTDEEDLKKHVAHVLRHGGCQDKADVIVEAIEFMVSCHMLKAHAMTE